MRGVRRRGARSARPPIPVPVHELHPLRAALHDRHHRAVGPRANHDARVPALRSVPGRVRGSERSPLPRRADRVPRVRPEGDPRACGSPCLHHRLDDDARRRRCDRHADRARRDRGAEGPRRVPPPVRRHLERGGREAPRAQAPPGQAVRADRPGPRGDRSVLRARRARARGVDEPGRADRAARRAPARAPAPDRTRGRAAPRGRGRSPRDDAAGHAAPRARPATVHAPGGVHERQPQRRAAGDRR